MTCGVPVLGSCALDEVKRGEYRAFFTTLKKAGTPDTTRSGVKSALSAMLSMAVEDEYFQGNPVFGHSPAQGIGWRCAADLAAGGGSGGRLNRCCRSELEGGVFAGQA